MRAEPVLQQRENQQQHEGDRQKKLITLVQQKRNGLISPRLAEKLLELLYGISENKKKASSMLKPNTKSLLPDRFGERIISAARIIFAAYFIEA